MRLTDERGNFHGRAFYSDKSQIAIRLLTREDVAIDRAFFTERMRHAAAYRKIVVENTEAFRLVYGEADQLPSLVVDRYGDYLVMQTLSQSTDRLKPLSSIFSSSFSRRGEFSNATIPKSGCSKASNSVSASCMAKSPRKSWPKKTGSRSSTTCARDRRRARSSTSAKTTWPRDASVRRSSRLLQLSGRLRAYRRRSCEHVEATDMAPAAIEAARRNQELNDIANVTFREGNSFDLLKEYDEVGRFHMVILDPPAFAKNRDSIPAAHRGYKEINLRALKLLKPGGFLVTCSCSYHISEALFLQIVAEAANDARQKCRRGRAPHSSPRSPDPSDDARDALP